MIIHKKEFYFIRHGQTDDNIFHCKVDHDDVSLNTTGFQQAQNIEPIIANLPIQSICFSPLKGGVHWALCCLLGISNHEWAIENCIPIHFFPTAEDSWTVRTLL